MAGLLDNIREEIRARNAQDTKFLRSMLYFFELRVPPHVAKGATAPYIYPLVMAPTRYKLSEPFAVEKSFTLGGGLFVEENGIIARQLSISGTTGFKPKHNRGQSQFSSILFPEKRSYTRTTAQYVLEAVSGHKHFQFLQDSVFRTYADLKRDPATKNGTELYFHVPKDDEHWRVVPLQFDLERDASTSRLTYPYSFELLVVDAASSVDVQVSEDRSTMDALRDTHRMIRSASGSLRGTIYELAGLQDELKNLIVEYGSIISDVVDISDATQSFLDGSASLITTPLNLVENTVARIEDALYYALMLGPNAEMFGESVLNSLRRINDSLVVIGSYPATFVRSTDQYLATFNARMNITSSRTQASLTAAEANAPQSLNAAKTRGTQPAAGDRLRAATELGLGREVPRYTGVQERRVEAGDSLTNLAARFLGDSGLWKVIALFNSLQAPYITEHRLPGTVCIGDVILIPTLSRADGNRFSTTTLGVSPEDPGAEQLLGTDFLLSEASRGRYDWVVDADHGAVDGKHAVGIENLKQGIRTRSITERGSCPLYPNLGTQRLVGVGVTAIDLEVVQYRIVEAIQADPRIAGVRRVELTETDGAGDDAIDIDIEAEVRGFTEPQRLRTTI